MSRRLSLGLIVNPVAGLGGRVGFKGTDGLADEALKRGAVPSSGARAVRALRRLAVGKPHLSLISGHGKMGQEAASEAGFLTRLAAHVPGLVTSAQDSQAAARDMMASHVDLILFAGGDGTARDIFDVVGDRVPVLGIPAGVKMQSAVFATSPEAAGEIVARLAAMEDRDRVQYRLSEVMDLDQELRRQGSISPRLFGYARVPHIPLLLQNAKARNASLEEGVVEGAARIIARSLAPGCLYAIGPGRTAKKITESLGLAGNLLGTDLVMDGKLVAGDANEQTILAHAQGRRLSIVVGVIGGQGYVFGRGNQEISPAVIRLAGKEGITIIAAQQKLLALAERRLLVDTGDGDVDRMLSGYWRVVIGPDEEMVMKVAAA